MRTRPYRMLVLLRERLLTVLFDDAFAKPENFLL